MLSDLFLRLRALFRPRSVSRELDAELRFHLDSFLQDLIRCGVPRQEALRRARIAFGGNDQIREAYRDASGVRFLDTLWQDLRFALRMLRKSPGFTVVAVLTLALGIGANTAIFTMANGLLLHTLPIRDPGRLVELLHHYPGEPEPGFNGFSWNAYQIMRDGNRVFSHLIIGSMNMYVVHGHELAAQTIFGGNVGSNYFETLGVRPAIGRLIGSQDSIIDHPSPVAVVSWSFWKSRFNLSPSIVGQSITANDTPLTIIGVTQRGFYGLSDQAPQDIWLPFSLVKRSALGWGSVGLLADLKAGVTIKQAQSEMSVLFQEAVNQPDAGPFVRKMQLRIVPAGDGVVTPLTQMLSTPLTVLMAIVGLLLLLACANLAGLLLARATSRQHEMAVRVCLGAGRVRLLRQSVTESLLLSAAGAVVGVFLAYFAAHALVRVFASGRFIRIAPVHFAALTTPDAHVLLFTGAITLLTALLCGVVPALSASRATPSFALQQSSRIGESRSRRLIGKGLVASQVALSLVLLSAAGLFIGYLSNLRNLNLGFERKNLLLVTLDFAHTAFTPTRFQELWQDLAARLDSIPGVSSTTLSAMSPLEGPAAAAFAFTQDHPEKRVQVQINTVAPDYFKTYGTPLLAGRDFSPTDQSDPPVAIMNEAAARDCFGSDNPIGRHVTLSHITLTRGERTLEVIGLVHSAKYNDLQHSAPPTIYQDLLQQGFTGSQLAIRTEIPPRGVAAEVRKTETSVLPGVSIVRMMTMNQQIDSTTVPQRLIAMLSAAFGLLGALLAAIGLYGLLAYTVTRRTHEIGVRSALGATRSDVLQMVFRDALWMVGAGLAFGIPLAFWAKAVAASLIHGLPANSPIYIVLGGTTMLVLGLIAAYIPARRAMRVDPMVALRYE